MASLLQMENHVIMIPLLCIMQRAGLHYCNIITYCYVIITQCSIITHYYPLQSPELADGTSTVLQNMLCQVPHL